MPEGSAQEAYTFVGLCTTSVIMEESALVDRVFLRIASTDSDEQFEAALHKFLPAVLLKLISTDENVRKKVLDLLSHINKRLKSRQNITLPIGQLVSQYKDPNNPSMVTNFSMIYIKTGFPRCSQLQKAELASELINLLPNKPLKQQETLLTLLIPVLGDIEFPQIAEKKIEMYGLSKEPATRSLLLGYMLDQLLLPYSAFFPSPDGPDVATKPQAPPCFSEQSYARAVGEGHCGAAAVEAIKSGILKYIIADCVPEAETVIHLLIAASDTRHAIATAGDSALRKLTSVTDWDNPVLIDKMMDIILGTLVNKKKASNQPKKETVIVPAPTRIKAKLYPYLLKSKYAASNFPKNIQMTFDSLFGEGTNAKLKLNAVKFVWNMADFTTEAKLKPMSSVLYSSLCKLIKEEGATNDVKYAAYVAIGKLVAKWPSLLADSATIVKDCLSALKVELSNHVAGGIHEALVAMTPSVTKASTVVKQEVEEMLASAIEDEIQLVRRICVYMAANAFPKTWLPTRYFLLLACADQIEDIRNEAAGFLFTAKTDQTESVDNTTIYPHFNDMAVYLEAQQAQRIHDKKTVTRGTTVMAFKALTLQKMVEYLRTCLAVSAEVPDPYTTDKVALMEQAPVISDHFSSSLSATDTDLSCVAKPKQQKLDAGSTRTNPLLFYCSLLMDNVNTQTTTSGLYLLLELLSVSPSLSKELIPKISWYKALVNHHDISVQEFAAQLLAVLLCEGQSFSGALSTASELLDKFGPTLSVEHQIGSILAVASIIRYSKQKLRCDAKIIPIDEQQKLKELTSKTIHMLVPLLDDASKWGVACQALSEINKSGSMDIPYGSDDSMDGEVNALSIVKTLCEKVKSSKMDSKQREKIALCLGSIGIGDKSFPWRRMCIDGLIACSSTKELELHFTVAQALVMSAQALDSSEHRDVWKMSENAYWDGHVIEGPNEMEYVIGNILNQYINNINPHIKQAACVWLLALVKQSSHFPEVRSRSSVIQAAFMSLLAENDDMTQDVASKGLGVVYDSCNEAEQKQLISGLLDTLMTGKSTQQQSGEKSGEAQLFSEGGVGKTPDGQGLSTYKELCSIANDLNQPDLIYKFLHLANHQAMWNSRKGAAFGFSTIAAQAGEQLAPFMSKIVPRLYRYTFDPNLKIQVAMRGIWNAVVKDNKPTVDKYAKEIMVDLLSNLTNNQWRVRESCCLAVNDLIRGRSMDNLIEFLPELWHVLFRLLDDIKESTRTAATTAANTLSRVSIRLCDVNNGKAGEQALSLVLPCILQEGITSNVKEVRQLGLDTMVAMSKNAGKFLKPHIHSLVPILLESLSGLEPQYLNYVALRVSGSEDSQQRLDKARVAASKMSPMMDSIKLCIQQVDGGVLPELIPRLTELIRNSIGLGTKVGTANVMVSLCLQCGKETLQPYTGKCMAALLHGLSDRNTTVRQSYASAIGNLCKVAKDSSVEKLIDRLQQWYMEKDDESLHKACAYTLKAISECSADTLNNHKSKVLPLVFLAMHKIDKHGEVSDKSKENLWKDIWSEVTIGTERSVRMYIDEFLSITNAALQSASWAMKAQGAAAMSTIASAAGSELDNKHLDQLLQTLITGLTGRTWNGKEVLLSALSQVVSSCDKALRSGDCAVTCDEIISVSMKEAKKESIIYKVHAIASLALILEALEVDKFAELCDILYPVLTIEEHDEEEISSKLMTEFRLVGFKAIGQTWPKSSVETQVKCLETCTTLLFEQLPKVSWKEQQRIWESLLCINEKTNLFHTTIMVSGYVESYTNRLISAAVECCKDNQYSAVRLAAIKTVQNVISSQKDHTSTQILNKETKKMLVVYVTDVGSTDSSLEVRAVCTSISAELM